MVVTEGVEEACERVGWWGQKDGGLGWGGVVQDLAVRFLGAEFYLFVSAGLYELSKR